VKCAPQSIFPIVRLVIIFLLVATACQSQVSFSTPPTYTGSGAVFVGDFNGDGKPDILAADGTLNLGNGDGTFKSGTAVTGAPLAVADFNGDGIEDILEQGTGTLLVLLGNGDGTFQPATSTNSGAGAYNAILATDLNGDGKADVLGLYNNNLVVYLSNGNGTFATGVSYPVGNMAFGGATITLGDFNGDGKLDAAISLSGNNAAGQEVVLLGNGDGTFQAGKISTGVIYPTSGVAGDFNGDGKSDLIIAGGLACTGTCTGDKTSILLGNGDGTFQLPSTIFSNTGTLAEADVNGDGKMDFVLLNSYGSIRVYLGNGDGTFSNTHSYFPSLTGTAAGLAIADFNSDGKLDIASANNILLGSGTGIFQGWPAVNLAPYTLSAAVIGNFVKNGPPAIAVLCNSSTSNSLCIVTDDGTGVLSLANTYSLQQPSYAIASADVNGDGNLDLVVQGQDPVSTYWSYSVLLGKGDGTFQTPVFYPQSVAGGSNNSGVVIADFNNDGKLDLAFPANNSLAVLLGNGDGTFGAPAYSYDGTANEILSADFNNDGNLDIAAAGSSGLALLMGNGNGTFQAAAFISTVGSSVGGGWAAAKLTGSGNADILFNNVYLGNGNGTFGSIPVSPAAMGVTFLADLNGDGKLDEIGSMSPPTSSHSYSLGVALGNGDGTFGPYSTVFPGGPFALIGAVGFVGATDMNGDGKLDLIGSGNSNIFIVLNTTRPVPADFTLGMASGASSSSTISAGQTATFNLALTPAGSFTGTVNLTCSIAPTVTPASLCSVPGSINLAGSAPTPVTVTVSTTASGGSGASWTSFPTGSGLVSWTLVLFAAGLVFLVHRRRPAVALAVLVLSLIVIAGCGGSGSPSTSSSNTAKGTPAGTYTATITATSGSLSHQVVLNVIVQ
jgi:hypothetical protein